MAEGFIIRGLLFEEWAIHHNLEVRNFGGMQEHVRMVYEDMKDAKSKKQVFLEMSQSSKIVLYFITFCVLFGPVLIACLMRLIIWCSAAHVPCETKDWLELAMFSFSIPVSLLTLLEITLGDSGVFKMISTGKAKVNSIDGFTKVTGLSRTTFWALATLTKAHAIARPFSGDKCGVVHLLKHDDVDDDDNWRSVSQSIIVDAVKAHELEHVAIADFDAKLLATAGSFRALVEHPSGWIVTSKSKDGPICYLPKMEKPGKVRFY